MPTPSQPPGEPPRPTVRPTRDDFVSALRELRGWSGLTLQALVTRHDILKVSTSSEYLRGARWPRWEWVHAFVTACLTHRGLIDSVRIKAEVAHWRVAWGHVEHHRIGQGQPQDDLPRQATPTEESAREPEGGAEAGDRREVPTTLRRIGAARGRWPGRWVLGGAVAAIVATTVVAVTAMGVLGNLGGGGSAASVSTATDSVSTPPTVPVVPVVPGVTYTETVNTPAGARTYTDPYNLIGEGPRITNGASVEVACVITAPSAPSVGLYWYLIIDPPWGGRYYSPANAFLNGDPPEGPYTLVVDEAVPDCPR